MRRPLSHNNPPQTPPNTMKKTQKPPKKHKKRTHFDTPDGETRLRAWKDSIPCNKRGDALIDLARHLGITKNAVYHWLRGSYKCRRRYWARINKFTGQQIFDLNDPDLLPKFRVKRIKPGVGEMRGER